MPTSSTSNTSVAFGGITPPAPLRAVALFRRNHEPTLAADLHALHAFIPALDHLPAAERKAERLDCDRASCRTSCPSSPEPSDRRASRCNARRRTDPAESQDRCRS